jgi:zinc/manganese transport system substrate-binding protein
MNQARRLFLMLSMASAMPTATYAAGKLPVTATFSILGDLVRVVGGERVSLTTLVGPDQDAHVFVPRPADVRAIVQSKLLVVNGLGFEPWAQKLVRSAGYKGATVVASEGVKPLRTTHVTGAGHKHESEIDPHAWQDPSNVLVYVRNLAAALTRLDPEGATYYQDNATRYARELIALDALAQAEFGAIPPNKRKVITSHDAFGYLAARYQIRFFAPQGLSTDAEPNARAMAQLIRQIQREQIKALFVENMSQPRLLEQLSRDAGVTVGPSLYADALSRPGLPGATYLDMMRHNITQLAAGMKLN